MPSHYIIQHDVLFYISARLSDKYDNPRAPTMVVMGWWFKTP